MNKKTLWITETAVMIALLVALQWATKPLGQFVTGSCVNLVLGVSVLVGGLWCGLTVALVSPFFAFLLGIGPAFLPIVPMVAVGNMVLVVILHLLASRDKIAARSYLAVAVGAVTKFLALWLLIVKLVLPTLGLAEKQVAAISASFSWPQLVTAAIGGVLAGYAINPLITLGAGAIGLVAGYAWQKLPDYRTGLRLSISVLLGHFVGSMVINSLALRIFYGYAWSVLLARIPNALVLSAVNIVLLRILLENRSLMKLAKK